jgi:predicted Rdx family selenoprotein
MTEVEIEYCAVCNFLPEALRTAERVLKQHAPAIDDVKLVTGKDRVFKVSVDDELVWDKGIDNWDVGDIERSIRPKIHAHA